MKLSVADISMTYRDIECPDKCPSCDADLKVEGGLKHYEYQDQGRVVDILNGEIDWGSWMPESGETDIPLSWECRKCGYELIVNSEERQVDRLPMISWFYSDPHFSHKNIAKVDYADRPWKEGVEDMNEALVARYNAVVQPSDFVLWVGDCFFCSFKKAKEYMGRLNGRKGLVIGNHDRSKRRMAMMGFEFVVDELMISIGERAVRVNHYPYWNDDYVATDDNRGEGRFKELRPPRVQGEVLIHGHTHSKQQRDGNMIHVGVDAWGYAPVRMKDVRELVQAV